MQLTTPIACSHVDVMASRFCLEAMVRQGYHVYCDIWQASRNEILQEARETPRSFGKVPHSSFASRGHVCINSENPTLVIITPPHSLRSNNFGALKFDDQASIRQIRQNLLPPIFSAIRYIHEFGIYRMQTNCVCSYCKVAGSNLTCRDDSKTRWWLHSVGPTSTRLSSLGLQGKISFTHQ